jgi:hypothetical protein
LENSQSENSRAAVRQGMCGDQGSEAASSNVTGFTFIPKNEHTYFAQHNKRVLLYQSFMEMQIS